MSYRLWKWYLLGAALALAGLMTMDDTLTRGVCYALIGLSAVAAMGYTSARVRGPVSRLWLVLALGRLAMVAGDLSWTYFSFIAHTDPFPSAADVFYLSAYPLTAVPLLLMARRHRTAHDGEAWLDSAVVIVGLVLPFWTLLVAPHLQPDGSLLARAILVAYPLGDVVLLAALTRLLVTAGARTAAFRLLALAVLMLLGADIMFMLTDQVMLFGLPLGLLPFLLVYVLMGAAALHPSAAHLVHTEPGAVPALTTRRLLTLMVAVLLAPAILVVQTLSHQAPTIWAVAIGSALLFVLVVGRMAGMMRRLKEQADQLDLVARTDPLTGVANRRTLNAQLGRECTAASRGSTVLAVALLDLDHFKAYNDSCGHLAGDRLLTNAAKAWQALLRPGEMLARYGGEEFVILMPGRGLDDAEALVGRARAATPDDQSFSAGLAHWDGNESPEQLLHRADVALYEAKTAGRRRTVRAAATLVADRLV